MEEAKLLLKIAEEARLNKDTELAVQCLECALACVEIESRHIFNLEQGVFGVNPEMEDSIEAAKEINEVTGRHMTAAEAIARRGNTEAGGLNYYESV